MASISTLPYAAAAVPQGAAQEQQTLPEEASRAAFAELIRSLQVVLATYSNVHRGSGHYSLVSTHLYEQAREIVLAYLGLNKAQYVVIFCTPRGAKLLTMQLLPGSFQSVSSQAIGLPLGVRALAVNSQALPRGVPFQTGGGTARLVDPGWVVWAKEPDKFEAGTPAIINIIAFAKALRLMQQFGHDIFQTLTTAADTGDAQAAATAILHHDQFAQSSGRQLLAELRQTQIGHGLCVPTREGPKPYLNLDNGASTPTFGPIWDVVGQAWRQPQPVQQALIAEVKRICADALGAPLTAYEVLFTSNTTEAINLVAESLAKAAEPERETVVLNTILEHNSNELPWRTIPGVTLLRLTVNAEGFIDLQELETLLRAYNQQQRHGKQRIELVAVSGASNVLGVYNDLAAISRLVQRYGARLLVDGAQLVAHRPIEMAGWGIDYLAFSAHKAYAPFGSGALVARKGLLHFSPAELALIQASSAENIGGIAALGKAFVLLQRIGLAVIQAEEQALTAQALRGLAQIPGITLYGIKDPDSPHFARKGGVIIFGLKNKMAPQVAKELAEWGIGVRAGCHCAHLLVKHVLKIPYLLAQFQRAIVGLFPHLALPGVTRVSLGIENSAEDVDRLLHVLRMLADSAYSKVAATNHERLTLPQPVVQQQVDDFVKATAQHVYG